MVIQFLLLCIGIFSGTLSHAATEELAVSAVREPNENWEEALARAGAGISTLEPFGGQPLNYAQPYHPNIDISTLPEWTAGSEALHSIFIKAREWRPHRDQAHPEFPRRAAWLYPKDGCYAKASHVAKAAEINGVIRPGKIFTFGRLKLSTPYDRRGYVYWTYHVASAYRMNGIAYVLDPAVEPTRALPLSEWMERIAKYPERIKIAFCNSYAYSPHSSCFGGTSGGKGYLNHMVKLLTNEWNTLAGLGFVPRQLLNNSPPW